MIVLIASLVVCVVKGLFLNALYKRMFDMTSPFSYLPICSEYIAIKLAFGSMLAKIYIIGSILVGGLSAFVPGIALLSLIFGLVNGVAWIIDLIKLITKNYGLCYLEPYVPLGDDGEVKLRLPSEKTKIPVVEEEKKEEETVVETTPETTPEEIEKEEEVGGQVLNLDYDDTGAVGNNEEEAPDVDVDDLNKNILDDDETVNNKEGESDLMNLFK